MFFLQDHLISIIIAGVVLLALAQIFLEARDSGIDSTAQYSGNIHALSFIDVIQRDFQNIGAGVDALDPMIIDYKWDNTDKYFVFRGIVEPDTSTTIDQIRYQLVQTDSIQTHIDGTLQFVSVYEIQREKLNSGVYQFAGASVATIRDFEIVLKNDIGTVLSANWDSTRQVEVKMITVPPLAPDQVQYHKEWQTTFRPMSLTMKN